MVYVGWYVTDHYNDGARVGVRVPTMRANWWHDNSPPDAGDWLDIDSDPFWVGDMPLWEEAVAAAEAAAQLDGGDGTRQLRRVVLALDK